ncbi:MAG TPA: class I SAM-dependent methyltransferase [Anaerolineales bacterium]|nr:class I SAM-dependent methyltransferase [Anaerolineales bacterium]
MTKNNIRLAASFRDPNGFIFKQNGKLYRQVNQSYASEYSQLMGSDLYAKLTKAGLLIPHEETDVSPVEPAQAFKVIKPEYIPFISYPYEWSFGLLKEAALKTLSIQKRALKAGMTLKDASAYNMQFVRGKAALIDSLSFDIYHEGEPWVAYRQFCQHFLAPLALMAHTDIRLSQLLRVYIDGIPLDLASRLLPYRSRLNFGLVTHIHFHARLQKQAANPTEQRDTNAGRMTKKGMLGLIENLKSTVKRLEWKPAGTEWGDYYQITNYSDAAFQHKQSLVSNWISQVGPKQVWDLGANDGTFSRLASDKDILAISFDIDPAAVEQNYRKAKEKKEQNIVPLLLDLTNPSPAIGWHNRERDSLMERAPADMVLALAVIHHLAISNNVPLFQIADFFADAGKWLVIEFVPKSDSQVQKLLSSRKDIFPNYTREAFEEAFAERFSIREKTAVEESERFLYLMEKK